MIRDVWACDDCGWEWPRPSRPPAAAECDHCGGELIKVAPSLVASADTLATAADLLRTRLPSPPSGDTTR